MLYLWKISQTVNCGYDTYDSAVVVAECEEEARMIHPGGDVYNGKGSGPWWKPSPWGFAGSGCWAETLEQVTAVKLVSIHNPDYPAGTIVVASFNAG